MPQGTKQFVSDGIEEKNVLSRQDYCKNTCFWILHLLKLLALTKWGKVAVQQVTGVFLEIFSVLSFIAYCTDVPDLSIGESRTEYYLLLVILSQRPVADVVCIKQPESVYAFQGYSCFQSELFWL